MTGQLFVTPPKLRERQRYVYDHLKHGPTDAAQAGRELHRRQRCPWCKPDLPCRYATSSGREVLEALRKKGLLRRDRHHVYRRTDSTPALAPVLSPEEEFGF